MVPEGIDFAQTNQRTQRWRTSQGGEAVCVYIHVLLIWLKNQSCEFEHTIMRYCELYKLYMKFSRNIPCI